MANSHGVPDVASELQSTCQDLLPACINGIGGLTPPGSGMVLAALTAQGYVFDVEQSVYVDQGAVSVTLSGAAGNFWLALHRDTSTAVAGWTRRPGSHYLWQTSVTQPANPAAALVFAQITVVGTNITAAALVPGVTRAEAWRTLAGLGSMATQNAGAVAITGGTATLTGLTVPLPGTAQINQLLIPDNGSTPALGVNSNVSVGGGGLRYNLYAQGTAPNFMQGQLGLATSPLAGAELTLFYAGQHGAWFRPSVDTGASWACAFANSAGTPVGTIVTSATTTAFNTTSDARLKHDVHTLTGELLLIKALRPVRFLWNVDDSPGVGFLAGEVAAHVSGVITGEADAVNEDGSVRPQMIDMSKLVPFLTGAVKTLAAQVEALTARLAVIEDGLGV